MAASGLLRRLRCQSSQDGLVFGERVGVAPWRGEHSPGALQAVAGGIDGGGYSGVVEVSKSIS